jgi:hypothetical protein
VQRGKSLVKRSALSDFGARFYARFDRTGNGVRAAYIILESDGTWLEADARLFPNHRAARVWLDVEAAQRGFSGLSIEFSGDVPARSKGAA